jgi:hypothetical protein
MITKTFGFDHTPDSNPGGRVSSAGAFDELAEILRYVSCFIIADAIERCFS